ncbi:MAG: outer membrane protein assembly factor BamD [Bacteroidales bacterium]|nr:outer membrane protein assembly factor BamD [Bacteroidales bacterium]
MSTSCNGYEKLLKSDDFEAKFAAAERYYNEGSYSRAVQLLENLTISYHGREHAEEIAWYYANALMKEKDYFTAGYHFQRYVRQYPYSTHTEEAAFRSAYCKYMDSPEYSLDQTTTAEAIKEFEQFVARSPQSLHVIKVNEYLDELRAKLMKKAYETAYEYYNIEEYHAAYVSFQAFLNLYPEAQQREDATFYLLRSGYLYAIGSREDKMKERLQQVVNDFDKFATSFRDSKYMSQAQDIYTQSRAALAKIEESEKVK